MKKWIFILGLLFFTLYMYSQDDFLYKKKQLGYIARDSTYAYVDGGTTLYNVVFYKIKYCRLLNTYTIKGRVFDPLWNVDIPSNMLFYKGINDTISRKVSKIKFFEVDRRGVFKVKTKFKNNERLYFYSVGYSLLEIDFVPQMVPE